MLHQVFLLKHFDDDVIESVADIIRYSWVPWGEL